MQGVRRRHDCLALTRDVKVISLRQVSIHNFLVEIPEASLQAQVIGVENGEQDQDTDHDAGHPQRHFVSRHQRDYSRGERNAEGLHRCGIPSHAADDTLNHPKMSEAHLYTVVLRQGGYGLARFEGTTFTLQVYTRRSDSPCDQKTVCCREAVPPILTRACVPVHPLADRKS